MRKKKAENVLPKSALFATYLNIILCIHPSEYYLQRKNYLHPSLNSKQDWLYWIYSVCLRKLRGWGLRKCRLGQSVIKRKSSLSPWNPAILIKIVPAPLVWKLNVGGWRIKLQDIQSPFWKLCKSSQ